MDIRPKRRKFKDNPYTLESIKDDNIFYIIFKDHTGLHKICVSKEIFNIFDESEKYENAKLKEYSVHIEHSEQSEISLNMKNVLYIKSLEEQVIDSLIYIELKKYINELSDVQKRRLIKYYFYDKTLKTIAMEEKCSINAIKHSIDRALETISKRIKKQI